LEGGRGRGGNRQALRCCIDYGTMKAANLPDPTQAACLFAAAIETSVMYECIPLCSQCADPPEKDSRAHVHLGPRPRCRGLARALGRTGGKTGGGGDSRRRRGCRRRCRRRSQTRPSQSSKRRGLSMTPNPAATPVSRAAAPLDRRRCPATPDASTPPPGPAAATGPASARTTP
jgi:hypothetical protein